MAERIEDGELTDYTKTGREVGYNCTVLIHAELEDALLATLPDYLGADPVRQDVMLAMVLGEFLGITKDAMLEAAAASEEVRNSAFFAYDFQPSWHEGVTMKVKAKPCRDDDDGPCFVFSLQD